MKNALRLKVEQRSQKNDKKTPDGKHRLNSAQPFRHRQLGLKICDEFLILRHFVSICLQHCLFLLNNTLSVTQFILFIPKTKLVSRMSRNQYIPLLLTISEFS